ncbi:hypothetical protein PV11_01648 [Exophiala sideris]|uniref:Uncharacterized protein n=1 Tax=Exophiala sideris TaxID=1016849 RepID=A0A0D1WBB3_9EURO|nr:hypothetical protein PV11_01648 [Exophiala sideris]
MSVKAILPRTTATSRPASLYSAASIDTLVAPDSSYRGFPSRQAYLEALREWAEEQLYYEADQPLVGFYGTQTTEEILRKQGAKMPKSRRATVAQLTTVNEGETLTTPAPESSAEKESKSGNRLKKVFSRRKSAAV